MFHFEDDIVYLDPVGGVVPPPQVNTAILLHPTSHKFQKRLAGLGFVVVVPVVTSTVSDVEFYIRRAVEDSAFRGTICMFFGGSDMRLPSGGDGFTPDELVMTLGSMFRGTFVLINGPSPPMMVVSDRFRFITMCIEDQSAVLGAFDAFCDVYDRCGDCHKSWNRHLLKHWKSVGAHFLFEGAPKTAPPRCCGIM